MDGAENAVDEDLERSKVGINSVELKGISRRTRLGALLVTILLPVLSLLRRSRRLLRLLSFTLMLERSSCRATRRHLQLYIFLDSRQNILHVGDVMLHQVFVEGAISL